MPNVPEQRWSCHACTYCCKVPVAHISDEERRRIDEQGWAKKLGCTPYRRLQNQWVLNKTSEGTCVFLDEENRCRIHRDFGESAKPLSCRMFPFAPRLSDKGWQMSLRFDCPSMARSQGRPINAQVSELRPLVSTLETSTGPRSGQPHLPGRLSATDRECRSVVEHFVRWLKRDDIEFGHRIQGAARVTATLSAASYKKVRGPRLDELLGLLFGVLADECVAPLEAPTPRQRGMLRQLTFAHTEHISLEDADRGVASRAWRRIAQLRTARRFLRGRGTIPAIKGIANVTTFDAVEACGGCTSDRDEVEEMLQRYLLARIESDSVFGAGYYGWPIFTGLGALWLALAVTGYLARCSAVHNQRTNSSLQDAVTALGMVDAAATRLPALGTTAERIRIAYLLQHNGIARLLFAYSP